MSARSTKRSSPQVELRDLTDWERVRKMTEEEIEAGAASDPDNPPWTEDDLRRARVVRAGSAEKPLIWVHVDEEVRRWVHERPGDTDQLINDLLRTAMQKELEGQGSG
ncbi:MAG: hypothetical protein ACREJ5_01475 [Geminicoccaceae bacterium]